jgi:transketolase
MRAAFIKALIQAARKDPNIWLLTADLGYSFLEAFATEFPSRFVNVGVAEQNMMLIASGLALSGKKVVVYSIINFATFRSLEQLRNSVCYHELDVTIVGVGAGYFYGGHGYTHHGIEDIAIMRVLPHLHIYSPMNALHTQWVTEKILLRKGPHYLRLGRDSSVSQSLPQMTSLDEAFLVCEGKEIMILALGEAAIFSLQIIKQLKVYSISAGLLTFPRVVPIDEEALVSAAVEYSLLAIIEEHRRGGLATSVAEVLMKRQLSVEVKTFCVPDHPHALAGSFEELRKDVGLTAESITRALVQRA